jgi:exodeoxyribonuclease VII small subunit
MASKSASTPATPATPAFEAALAQLESLVSRLESGDLPLDEALRTFEQGVRLTRECQSALAAAQQKVQQLLQRGGTLAIEDIDATATLETTPSE